MRGTQIGLKLKQTTLVAEELYYQHHHIRLVVVIPRVTHWSARLVRYIIILNGQGTEKKGVRSKGKVFQTKIADVAASASHQNSSV